MSEYDEHRKIMPGSGNVFADLGFANPEEALLKAQLIRHINAIISQSGMTQTEAAEILGIAQPNVSALANGRLSGFSVDRLIRFLTMLGHDVNIVVKPAHHEHGEARVSVVA